MTGYRQPLVVMAVEQASKRAAREVRQSFNKRVNSLRTVAAGAALMGLLGTVVQITTHTFYSCGGNWGSCAAPIGGRLADALSLKAAGLLVSLMAMWFHRHLLMRMEMLDLEMESASQADSSRGAVR